MFLHISISSVYSTCKFKCAYTTWFFKCPQALAVFRFVGGAHNFYNDASALQAALPELIANAGLASKAAGKEITFEKLDKLQNMDKETRR